MRPPTIGDWIEVERAGYLRDGQIAPECYLQAIALLYARCSGLSLDQVRGMPLEVLTRDLPLATSPGPESGAPPGA